MHVRSGTTPSVRESLHPIQPEIPEAKPIIRDDNDNTRIGDDTDLIQNLNKFSDADLFRMCAAAQCDIAAGFDSVTLTMSRESGCSHGFMQFASLLCSGFDTALEFVARFNEDSIIEPAAWGEYDVKNWKLRLDHYSAHSPTALYVFYILALANYQRLMDFFSAQV